MATHSLNAAPKKTESNFVGAMSNFSIQYNLSAASAPPSIRHHNLDARGQL